MAVATGSALVRYTPALAPLEAKTHWRYRHGFVMEMLERRRLLCAAGCEDVALDDVVLDDSAIVVDAEAGEGEAELYYMTLEFGAEEGEAGVEYVDEWSEEWYADDTEIYQLTMFEDGGEVVEDGVDWPVGWGWTLDRLPTPEETTAANNDDDLGGLWVPVRTFGGDEDPLYEYEELYTTTGEDGGEYEPWIAYSGVPKDGGPVDGEEVALPDGEVVIDDESVIYLTGAPAAESETDEPAAEEAGPGGGPAPVEFAALVNDGRLLGKLQGSVTDDDESDLPFLN